MSGGYCDCIHCIEYRAERRCCAATQHMDEANAMGTPSLGQRNRHTVVGIYGTLKGNETSSINGRTSHRTRRSAHTVRYCPTKMGLLPRFYPSSCFHMVNPLDTLGKDTTPCTSTMVLARNCERHKAHRTIAPSLSSLARRSPIDAEL